VTSHEGSQSLDRGSAADTTPDIAGLRAYTRAKQALAREIRTLRRLFTELKYEKGAEQCQELTVKLAEDRFTLAVLGQFKRGKSSLMNAVIGRDLLPTGVLPLTSAITILRFGPRERLVIRYRDHNFPQDEPIARLPAYVTENGNPGNQKGVRSAVVEVPLPFLRNGVEFVDSPGVGSAIEANTATAYDFLPQCDAVLFVVSVEAPVTKAEIDFLARIRECVRSVFFVVNKIDLVSEGERADLLRFVGETLRRHVGGDTVRLFPVSSRLALAAKQAGDAAAYAASGLKALEETLAEFLSKEKAATFLVAVADKALRLLHDGARKTSATSDATGGAGLDARTAAVAQRLERFRARLLPGSGATSGAEREEEPEPPAVAEPILPPVRADEAGMNLLTRGCPVCRHLGETAFDFMAKWQHALSEDEGTQRTFAADLGFCPLHTWQLVSIASPHGLSLGYPLLAERIAAELASLAARPAAAVPALRASLPSPATCRACSHLRQTEQDDIGRLAGRLRTPDGRAAYEASQGLCLRHLAMLLPALTDEDTVRLCLAHTARRFDEAAEDMQNFAMKHEALRRALQNRDEQDAYLRAVIHLVGERSSWVWDPDREL
jgi:GTP-binding protein EngB required for normal cell division